MATLWSTEDHCIRGLKAMLALKVFVEVRSFDCMVER